MSLASSINKLRTDANLSQEQFAAIFGVSQQSVQKWENGDSAPELSKLIRMSKRFGVSLDALILGYDNRVTEILPNTHRVRPQYANMHDWEFYSANLLTEYRQSLEEGLDVDAYKDIFTATARLPKDEITKKLGDVLYEVVAGAPLREDYRYTEPSDLESIRVLRNAHSYTPHTGPELKKRITGAWLGRICGCLLGKPVEGVRTNTLIPMLKDTGNYPMHRYILRSDLTEPVLDRYGHYYGQLCYADTIDGMPMDDDTNYTVMYQQLVDRCGRDFTSFDISRLWLEIQKKDAYCTAERVAYCNFIKGYAPPDSATYKNPYREWIGAQIRGDYFGYINPGDPETAAEMAWRDACISHTKNGIYGEMFVAAMLAIAAQTDQMTDIILGGMAQIPATSRLYEQLMWVVDAYHGGVTQAECFRQIHHLFNEHDPHDWCHTIPNAMIVAASLLYGQGDFSRTVCMAVEAGFDTDCNGATAGSVFGMTWGIDRIGREWTDPLRDTPHTTLFGLEKLQISQCIEKTLAHLPGVQKGRRA